MKFALFLICALVAVQGFHARTVEVQPETRELLNIGDTIREIIKKIEETIKTIISQLPEIIENIKNKIKEILDELPNIIKEIKKKIEELINLGAAGKKCVEQYRGDIEALVKFAKQGVESCAEAANEQSEEVKKLLLALHEKVVAFKDDVVSRVKKCVEDNKLNPIAVAICLRKQVDPIKKEAEELAEEVSKTIAVAKELGHEIRDSLTTCVRKVHQDVADKEAALIANIKKCIEESS